MIEQIPHIFSDANGVCDVQCSFYGVRNKVNLMAKCAKVPQIVETQPIDTDVCMKRKEPSDFQRFAGVSC